MGAALEAEGAPPRARSDDDLRHPRPDRGADLRRQGGGDADGRVVQSGTPEELFEQPAHTFVGYFIGSPGMNIVPAEVRGREARSAARRFRSAAATTPCRRAPRSRSAFVPNSSCRAARRRACWRARSSGSTISVASGSRGCGSASVKFAARVPPGFSIPAMTPALMFEPSRVHVYADSRLVEGAALMEKTVNQKAWFLVLPVLRSWRSRRSCR